VLVARVNVFILLCLICTVCVCVCACERVCVCWCGVQVLPAVTRFGGMPEVTIDGDIIYTFDDLQVPISFLHGISFFLFFPQHEGVLQCVLNFLQVCPFLSVIVFIYTFFSPSVSTCYLLRMCRRVMQNINLHVYSQE